MPSRPDIVVGMNGRFFPNNWRPALQEIAFAHAHQFGAIQFGGKEEGLGPQHLGADLETVGTAIRQAQIVAVMEIMVRVDADGRTEQGYTLVDVLNANLGAITAFGCRCVHWHAVPRVGLDHAAREQLEALLTEEFRRGVEIVAPYEFRLGFEHNEPNTNLLSSPAACARTLEQVPGLAFVWDINHTTPDDLAGFASLISRTSMLHVSDTPLPEVNHHLPLGLGSVDYVSICRTLRSGSFHGPAILEIGGLPKSGGFNRDTDEALVDSRRRLEMASNE